MAIENLCLNVYFDNNVFGPYTFSYTGVMNNHSYWYSSMDDLTIQYNQDAGYWEVLNIETIINAKLRNTTNLENPVGNWAIVGLVPSGEAIVTSGTCSTYPPLSIRTKVANNTCPKKCNGAIFASAIGDNKPYKFSINNGVTYTSNPIFNNLCEGEYNIRVSGQTGSIVSKFVTVNVNDSSQIYSLSLETISTPILPNNTKQSFWKLNTSPELKDGATILVGLDANLQTIISQPGTGTTINNISIYKNGTLVVPTTTTTSVTQTDRVNCTPYKDIINLTGFTYSVIISGGTVLSGITTSIINDYNNEISNNGCQTNITQKNILKIISASINNCECCSVNFDSANYVGINKHSR
ncbi:MAG: hypothetical protein K9I82_02475 [Chitinophagaceae bacterium]|nr:hypothetical protein [Chitinophagaceae bacterium]